MSNRSIENRGGLLSKPKRYSSVAEMVRDTADDKEKGESLARKIEERNIISYLVGLRTAQDLSQGEIANRMGCSQSKVSKLESGPDNNLSIGDFEAYARALGFILNIQLGKRATNLVERLRFTTNCLHRQMEQLKEYCAHKDNAIRDGAFQALMNTTDSLMNAVRSAIDGLRTSLDLSFPDQSQESIQIHADSDEVDKEDDSFDSPAFVGELEEVAS